MQLYEKGKLDLNRPISEYIPNFQINGGESISVIHLLQHSSGIGGYESEKETENTKEYPTLRDAMKVFENRELKFSPGSNFYYTSYGYVVLGWVIENVSGLSYEAYVKENILTPAGMHNTGVEKFNEPIENQTKLYTQKNTNPKKYSSKNNKIKEKDRTNLSNRTPGGGFYSTAEDLLKFGQAILNNQLITEASLDMIWTDSGLKKEGNPYGMGWFLYGENPKYGNVYGHGGTQTGASNQLMILPKEDLVIVIMSNTSHTWGHVFGMVLNFFEIAANDGKSK
jgi:CubicO group peptidase (beta-lactamase class C family)